MTDAVFFPRGLLHYSGKRGLLTLASTHAGTVSCGVFLRVVYRRNMRVAVILVALAVVAQLDSARAADFLVEETLGDVVNAGEAENGVAGEVADVNSGDVAGDAGGRKLLYTAPQVVTTTAPAGVNCAWGAWSAWSTCYQNAYSKDEPLRCNLGVSRRTRVKTTFQTLDGTCPESTNDCAANSLLKAKGIPCTHYDEVLCNIGTGMTPISPFPPTIDATTGLATGYRPCPVDCVFSSWGPWSQCNAECGQHGIQYRKRTVQVPPQPSTYFTGTNQSNCETAVLDGNDDYKGVATKLATGFPCGTPCRGNLTEVRSCFRKECPVDCVWSDWSPWSGCSKLCGGGTQYRTRYVKEPPQHGGKLCKATACSETSGLCTTIERRKCNEVSCAQKRIREKQDDASVDQDLCQYKNGVTDCPATQTRTGGAHTAVGANPRPNDPVQADCLADKSCKDTSNVDLFEAKNL